MLLKLLVKLKPFVIILLFIVFLGVFGLPAFKTFTSYDVFVKESKKDPEPLLAPAITICLEPVS